MHTFTRWTSRYCQTYHERRKSGHLVIKEIIWLTECQLCPSIVQPICRLAWCCNALRCSAGPEHHLISQSLEKGPQGEIRPFSVKKKKIFKHAPPHCIFCWWPPSLQFLYYYYYFFLKRDPPTPISAPFSRRAGGVPLRTNPVPKNRQLSSIFIQDIWFSHYWGRVLLP